MHSLQDLLNSLPEHARARGAEYRDQGRVRVLRRVPHHAHALVRGTREYSVVLELVDDGWTHRCTCPAHGNDGVCKHVGALLWAIQPESAPAPRAWGVGDHWDFTPQALPGDAARGEQGLDAQGAPHLDEELADLFDLAIERTQNDRSLPYGARMALLARLQRGDPTALRARGVSSPSRGGRLLLDTLEASAPEELEPRRGLCLRYRLWAPPSPSEPPTLEIQAARLSASGLSGAYRTLAIAPPESQLDETDRLAVAVLMEPRREEAFAAPFQPRRTRFSLPPALQKLLLPSLARDGRVTFASERLRSASALGQALILDEASPWDFTIEVRGAGKSLRFGGSLEREGERIPLGTVDAVLGGGFAVVHGRLLPVHWHGALGWASALCGMDEQQLAGAERPALARLLSRAPVELPVRAPGLLEELAGAPRPVLSLLAPEVATPRLRARIEFDYGTARLGRGTPPVMLKGDCVLRVRRDREAEALAEAQFTAAGGRLRAPDGEDCDGTLEVQRLGDLVRSLAAAGWLVEGEGAQLRTGGDFSLAVSSGIDWFELSADIRFDGVGVELELLLEALERRQAMVRLADGTLGLMPESWLARWKALGALGELHGGALRFGRSQGFLLDALLQVMQAERAEVSIDQGFRELRQRLAQARDPAPLREGPEFAGELRPYQRIGLGWLTFLEEVGMGGCLADDMGLGKTVQVLALVERRRPGARGPTLVVAPKTLLFNWEREARRFVPGLSVRIHHGAERATRAKAFAGVELLITTYATLRQDIELFGGLRFDLVVLDEAQAIKNARSQSAKAVRLLKAEQRLALTGTPIENRVEDLLSIFEFLNPGLLDSSRVLRKLLEAAEGLETARLAARTLGPFLLRRTKEQVLTDLPPKSEQRIRCELGSAQRRIYDGLREHYRRTLLAEVDSIGIERAGINVLEALLRLRQAACHVALVDPKHRESRSAKLDTLVEMLEELRDSGHKALVFSQFTSFLALVKPELESRGIRYDYLDGATRDREARVDAFQRGGDAGVFLISLKAGGVGLNLTAADYVFLLDPWWNPAVERQAIDRTHRIGQTRPVTAYRLVASDTVEEKILALQEHKRALADALFEGAGSMLRDLTRADLEAILS
ncbi:MAG: DEAD/DEAH box helicase [Planctomycetes bacterium]|nr:DEAD/DEAH box helicase [Planctomycetota bacterium]